MKALQSTAKAFKGKVPKVQMVAHRLKNKKVTELSNLEFWQVDHEELCQFLRTKLAASATVLEWPEGSKKEIVRVQGNQIKGLTELLESELKIPAKHVKAFDKIKAKNKQKAAAA